MLRPQQNKNISKTKKKPTPPPNVIKASTLRKVFKNKRKTVGVRTDIGLYKAVKPILIARYGSVCRPWEAFLVAHLAMSTDPASFNYTTVIENLSIERNLRPRRRLEFSDNGEQGEKPVCSKCDRRAVFNCFFKNGESAYMCKKHKPKPEFLAGFRKIR